MRFALLQRAFDTRRAGPVTLLALVAFLAACDQAPPRGGELPAPRSFNDQGPVAEAPGFRVEGLPQSEASVPFGMLKSRPGLVADNNALALRHARGSGVADLQILLITDKPLEVTGASSGPGWYNIGPADRRVLEAAAASHSMHYRFARESARPLTLDISWRGNGPLKSLSPARGARDLTGHFEGADGTRLFVVLSASAAFREATALGDGATRLRFAPSDTPLEVSLALSTVSLDGARANLAAVAGQDFAELQRAARQAWAAPLARVSVSGSAEQQRSTGLALQRVLSHYGDLSDRDGRYRAPNGEIRRVVPSRRYIANLSLADDYRTVLPLLSLLAPAPMADLFDTMLAHQRSTGVLPQATAWGMAQEPGVGAPDGFASLPAMAGLVARELPGISAAEALPAALREELTLAKRWPWDELLRLGYFSFESFGERSVALSLEASQAQHALAVIAAAAGEREMAQSFATRALLYRQLFDRERGRLIAKDRQRRWAQGGDAPLNQVGREPATLWLAGQFDLEGLLSLLGGRQGLTDALDQDSGRYSAVSRWHVPWLYAFSNRPAAGQQRPVFGPGATAPETAPEAARYLFHVLGFYPVNPLRGSYVLGLPMAASARMQTGEATVLLEAPGLSPGQQTRAVRFNGSRLPGLDISHRRLSGGGELLFMLEPGPEVAARSKPARVWREPNPGGSQSAGVLLGGERF